MTDIVCGSVVLLGMFAGLAIVLVIFSTAARNDKARAERYDDVQPCNDFPPRYTEPAEVIPDRGVWQRAHDNLQRHIERAPDVHQQWAQDEIKPRWDGKEWHP